ncbi:iron-containing redox enzyme family protein [Acinetobacter baumannii]|uniref:iron-containing redox enzyme family protein n=1 Tax=Acinetobacter baumannii TaxID=470 RepID=UPI001C0C06AE|nr:iron-containing redox enzyme family protein [Acinetobacter baumannii]MBU3082492.1 iron-containing redox enzyme family protein [Acinetobacter baumannii]MDC4652075.1 iron-containing redox enzyme family protein [Acinetobacter baumannii]MDC5116124.1 iron-containing redox enzyme family protein [Acinetobacter baumannii]MDC5449585.1 iron-containing redox enzyme family protein [Acinetobacter baumannii]
MNEFIKKLDEVVTEEWAKIKSGEFWTLAMSEAIDPELYKNLMEEIYHYTKHNSINQATAAYKTLPEQRKLLRFVYKHALEELGHENMVINDLKSVDLYEEGIENRKPLPATQALISFLYLTALEKGAIPRLGYSFWAETCYDHIDELLKKIALDLNLQDKQMTFFVAHSEIDAKHSTEVNDVIMSCITSNEEFDEVMNTAQVTLYLTGQMLEQVAAKYKKIQKLKNNKAA